MTLIMHIENAQKFNECLNWIIKLCIILIREPSKYKVLWSDKWQHSWDVAFIKKQITMDVGYDRRRIQQPFYTGM